MLGESQRWTKNKTGILWTNNGQCMQLIELHEHTVVNTYTDVGSEVLLNIDPIIKKWLII